MSIQTSVFTLQRNDRRADKPETHDAPGGFSAAAEFVVGFVTRIDPDGWVIDIKGSCVTAKRAVSCLIDPAVGDQVACIHAPEALHWIVAVLRRDVGAPLVLGGNEAVLQLRATTFSVRTQEMNVDSQQLCVRSAETTVSGTTVQLIAGVVKLTGSLFSSVFERVHQLSRHCLRTTQGLDRVQAEHIEVDAGRLLRMQGEHAIIQGEKIVKARGGQIHLG